MVASRNVGVRSFILVIAALVAALAILLAGGTQHALADENGAAYARFDSGTGTLTFFRSENVYTTNQTETYIDGEGNEQTITYYADIETTDWPASTSGSPKWRNKSSELTRVVFEDEIAPISTNVWFYGQRNIKSIEGIEKLDTSKVTSMWYMFGICSSLEALDLSQWDVSQVTNFSDMFAGCQSLTELDVSGFDTSQAVDMRSMFSGCNSLTELDLSGFDTSNVTNMAYMFRSCTKLTSLDISGFDTSSVENMKAMFSYCEMLASLDVSHFDTSHVTDMGYMFQLCYNLTDLNLSGWDTRNVASMEYLFDGCSHLTSLDVSGLDTSNVESMKGMFDSCAGLTSLDVSTLDTSKVTDMSYMFTYCAGLTSLDVSDLDTSQVKSFKEMFSYCYGLTELDLSGLDTSQVEDMSQMFEKCKNLVYVNMSGLDASNVKYFYKTFSECPSLSSLNFTGFKTSSATSLRSMFYGCTSLTSLDLSMFGTSNVTTMDYVFDGCSSLTAIDVSGWDTSSATTMEAMFKDCSNLSILDVSGFDTSQVTSMAGMFLRCKSLSSIDVSGFNTSQVTSMGRMFEGCSVTSLDVAGYDTSKVTYMSNMFSGCEKVAELDLSGFDTSKVEDMYGLFGGCSGLKSLKLGEKTKLGSNINLSSEWQLASVCLTPVRYESLEGFDGSNPGWYLQGYFELAIEGVDDAVYTGEAFEPTPAVSADGRALVAGADYTLSYANNTNAGTATVTVTGAGRWTGSSDIAFEIAPKPIEPAITLSATTLTYNGGDQDPGVTVKDGDDELVVDEDYEVTYPDGRKNVGTHTLTVTCKGNYSGNGSAEFSIVAKEITPTVTLSPAELAYDGGAQAPEVVVMDGDDVLAADVDYDVALPDGRTDVGEYEVGVTLKGNYSGSGRAEFAIVPKAVEPTVVLSPAEFTYDGGVQTPEVAVKDGEVVLAAGRDYDVALPDGRTDAGTYEVGVTLKGNYSGSGNAAFEIVAQEAEFTVALSPTEFTYNGGVQVPEVVVRDAGGAVVGDYDVAFPDGCKDVGTYTVTVTRTGNYSGSASATFEIVPKEVGPTVTLTPAKFTYDGKAKTPEVVVKDGGDVLVAGRDYDVALPKSRTNAGTYAVKVTLKGDYSGSASASFAVGKAANTMSAQGKTVKLKSSKLQKKAQKVKLKKAMAVKKGAAKSKLTYKLGGVSKKKFKRYFKVNAKTGAITVKKGLKKGTYTVKVKVTAAATKNYKAKTTTAKVTIRVK